MVAAELHHHASSGTDPTPEAFQFVLAQIVACIGIGEDKNDIRVQPTRSRQRFEMTRRAVGSHRLNKSPGLLLIFPCGKEKPPAPGRWTEYMEPLVVKNQIELLHFAKFIEAPEKFLFGCGERSACRLSHAGRAVKHIHKPIASGV